MSDRIYTASSNTELATLGTFKPRSQGYKCRSLERDQFERKVFSKNLTRLRILRQHSGLEKIISELNSILTWEYKLKSIFSLFLYIQIVYIFQPWMLIFAILVCFLCNAKKTSSSVKLNDKNYNHLEDDVYDDVSSDEMDEVEVSPTEEQTKEKTSIKTRINRIQKIALWVQQMFEKTAHWGECIKNLVEFKVPFLSWIVVAILFVSGLVVYLIPLRYIIMLGGSNKILKGLIRPNSEGSLKRLLHFMSKVPDDEDLRDREVLKFSVIQTRDNNTEHAPRQGKFKRFSNKKEIRRILTSKTNSTDSDVDGGNVATTVIAETNNETESDDESETCWKNTDLLEGGYDISGKDQVDGDHNTTQVKELVRLSYGSVDPSHSSDKRRMKDLSTIKKELSEISKRKTGELKDKIMAKSTSLPKNTDDPADTIDTSLPIENSSNPIPRNRKRDKFITKLIEKTGQA